MHSVDASTVHSQLDLIAYRPLIWISQEDTVDLARSLVCTLTWNRAGTVFTLRLNPKWHRSNGAPVTSRDVLFTWQIMKDTTSGLKGAPWAYYGQGMGGLPNLWQSVTDAVREGRQDAPGRAALRPTPGAHRHT